MIVNLNVLDVYTNKKTNTLKNGKKQQLPENQKKTKYQNVS